ncbi:MAG: glutamine-hydrolyzing carbamoyl-phosphate synthase small subunit [Nanoarchaeota archaeon]|nr:glutamine-hydrolyzing carbamoyl-phosphate synthase small subunit [Nanoarchaeota archaeon]MBU1704732.1 glutamine-hydrolyzing carbamoyl-phosphate synthase small subunit [Nanoarchaeota archaeon]
MDREIKAKLVLQDGSVFYGYAFGAAKSSAGEVVFNTGMVGYPESLTDPSYKGQILTLTYPLIGNYGVPPREKVDELLKYFESDRIQIQGLIISDYCAKPSHWNSVQTLSDWMKSEDIPGIYGIDTRELTKKLRTKGTMLGKIVIDKDIKYYDPNKVNLVEEVSVKEPVTYEKGHTKVVLIDTGVKNNIIRSFLDRDVTVIRVPWDYNFNKLSFDGLFISNGPGDPKMCKETIANVRVAMDNAKPIFGICLGNQILGLAAGGDTYKLKFGHRGQNQPCIEVGTKKCYITSQNHGFAVKTKSLPRSWEPWFVNANDKTNEGIKHKRKPFFSVQFHPEATPGPVDTGFLFDKFIEMI